MRVINVIIIGAGNRVQSTALPALEKLNGLFSLRQVFSRTVRPFRFKNADHVSARIEDLKKEDLAGTDLLYIAVTTEKVPSILKILRQYDLSHIDLLLETPVLSIKHLHFIDLLSRFRNTWVGEDSIDIPCFDVARDVIARGDIGELKEIRFLQSAFHYHALALLKNLLKCNTVLYGYKVRAGPSSHRCRIRFSNLAAGTVFEPRDYSKGKFILLGTKGSLSDYRDPRPGNQVLEPLVSDKTWSGFRVGNTTSSLSEEETELLGTGKIHASITSRMHDMKRVGFYRLLKRIHEGNGAYPLVEALDDTIVDYFLQKLRFYVANPVLSIKSSLGAFLLKRLAGALSR